MSYAGKTARGRRTVPRDETPSGTIRHRISGSARPLDRGSAFTTRHASRAPRSIDQNGETELDWKRVALFATGALLGVAVGAGAALLLAPQTGEETRRDLARQGRRLRTRTADAWDDLRDELRWAARRGRRRLDRSLRDRRLRREERALRDAEVELA